jgi:hypothetical protein
MVVRDQQMREFDSDVRRRYHLRLLQEFRANLPEVVKKYDDASLLRLIETSHRDASIYDIHTDKGLRQFITIAVIAGIDFHLEPRVHSYLELDGMSGDQRINLLSNYLEHEGRQSPEWPS